MKLSDQDSLILSPKYFLLEATIQSPFTMQANKILCLPQEKFLLINPSEIILFDFSTKLYSTLLTSSSTIKDLKNFCEEYLLYSSIPFENGGGFWIQVEDCFKVFRVDLRGTISEINFRKTCGMTNHFWKNRLVKRIFNKKYLIHQIMDVQLEQPIVRMNKYYLTADSEYVIDVKDKQPKIYHTKSLNLLKLETKERVNIELKRQYNVATSIFKTNMIGVYIISDSSLIIIENVSPQTPHSQFKILSIDLKTHAQYILLTLDIRILDFKGINRQLNLISFIVQHKHLINCINRAHVDWTFDYKNKKLAFERQEINGLRNSTRCFQKAEDLKFSVELVKEKFQQKVVFRKFVEVKKVLFHLVKNSKLGERFGEDMLTRKLIDLLC